MSKRRVVMAGCTILAWSIGSAFAGPCDTTGRAASERDAGSGPTVGYNQQTTGAAGSSSSEHPPTSTMNRASDATATSSQDAQKQMQGQPTAAQQAQGAKPGEKMADDGC
ncbi:MAG: hypothetical protein HY852_06180 [Bradyrhizobium sp.]|uniref:hypothetical protein n=1 Tax=Bradyrhizobium sp. TaxID=376 RepID=UPI0025BAE91A|nr:hypothetical protein [Bradyrhizobium sp.]MBI5261391.1 hypothetical protein [Bradyrhizobium sp.]